MMGTSHRGKKTAGPAPSGLRRSAKQFITTESKQQQKNVIATVALQTGYKVQPTPVVSDALSEEDMDKKSESHVSVLKLLLLSVFCWYRCGLHHI